MRTKSCFLTPAAHNVERAVGISPCPSFHGERFGSLAAAALSAELDTWPKPGLVSPVDRGSHDDMDYATFQRSVGALRPFFGQLAIAGANRSEMDELRDIGWRAEAAMLAATAGVNTHRGAIFALGLMCAAAGMAVIDDASSGRTRRLSASRLGAIVRRHWGSAISRGPIVLNSNGSGVLRRFGAGGARAEAAAGFPHAIDIGLPALRKGRSFRGSEEEARVHAFFALLAQVEDTNLLHRGGMAGLGDARSAAEEFLAEGGVGHRNWLSRAMRIHRAFVARRLSPGGSADLLAVTIFVDHLESTT